VSEPLVSVEDLRGGERVRLPLYSVSLPRRFSGRVDDPDLPYLVELTITFGGDRVVCEHLACHRRDGGAPVTSEGMTHVRVADLVYLVALVATKEQSTLHIPGRRGLSPVVLHDLEIPAPPPGRSGPTAEHLRTVGVIYTLAYACGGSPRRSVMEALGLARTTANRWIRLARERGQLPSRGDDQEGE
jgi:hypothetical protein